MVLEYQRKEKLGLVFSRGHKLLHIAMKVKVIGTHGTDGVGMIRAISFYHGTQYIDIVWASREEYKLGAGQKVRFTKE